MSRSADVQHIDERQDQRDQQIDNRQDQHI